MRFAFPILLAVSILPGCSAKETPRATASSASAAPSVAAPPAQKPPPTPSEEVTFDAADKAQLAGTLYLSADKAAPLVVLVHRYRGDRQEWQPLTTTLASSDKRYNILSYDERGHGGSRSGAKKPLDWGNFTPKDMPTLANDVLAAIDYGIKRTDGSATRVVLVGSSLGAAFVARAASHDARVVAVALVSPGASIEGFDVYHPFADVRMLPSFLVCAKDDNVCKDPVDGLSRMAKEAATVKIYEGRGHGAAGIFAEGPTLAKDLEAFLMGVYDAQPMPRELVPRDTASGKKPSQKGSAS